MSNYALTVCSPLCKYIAVRNKLQIKKLSITMVAIICGLVHNAVHSNLQNHKESAIMYNFGCHLCIAEKELVLELSPVVLQM